MNKYNIYLFCIGSVKGVQKEKSGVNQSKSLMFKALNAVCCLLSKEP